MASPSTAAPHAARDAVWRWAGIALTVSVVAVLIDLLAGIGEGTYTITPQVTVAFNVVQFIGVGLAVRAWRHPALDRRSRRAWGLIAVAYVLLSISGVLRAVYPAGLNFPSPADLFRLAFAPMMLAGLLTLPLRVQDRRARQKVGLDVLIVMIASATVLWYLDVAPSMSRHGWATGAAVFAAVAYPAFDLMLIFGVSVVIFRGAIATARRPALLLGVAMVIVVLGDVYLAIRQSQSTNYSPDRWQYACWLTGHCVITMAAYVQCRVASRRRDFADGASAGAANVLPYLAVGLCYLLLVLAVRGQQLRILGMVTGAVLITGVVVARQIIALRQNHELAITDPLTGLVNRRHLYDRLRLALVRGARNSQHVAALLIDMNGFKQINDTLGHEAGDQLLVAFGRILQRNVLGLDVVGRLGGDEFAVVLHDIDSAENALAVARRIMADMQHPVMIGDTPVQPRAAIGLALSKPGELTADELMHHADLAMYDAKGDRTTHVACYSTLVEQSETR